MASEIFADSRAKKKRVSGHRSLLSAAGRYFKNVLKYDTFFNKYPNFYPYEHNKLNKWFTVEVFCPWAKQEPPVKVPFYNANNSSSEARSAIKQKVRERESNGVECWFHGTSNQYALDIVNKGIDLKKGKEKLDFSNQDGFYLNADGMSAVNWATSSQKKGKEEDQKEGQEKAQTEGKKEGKKKGQKFASVIIYEVTVQMLNDHGLTLLDLRGDPERWKKVVKWNRSGRQESECLDEELNEQFEQCDYIRGPMVGDRAKYDGPSWEPPKIRDSDQICVKTKKMAKVIGHPKNIVGVVSWNDCTKK